MYQAHHAIRLNRAVAERKAAIAANRHKLSLLNLAEAPGALAAAPAQHDAAGAKADIDAWARHAQGSNGFGGADLACTPAPAATPARAPAAETRATTPTGLHSALLACRDFVAGLAARHAQRRAARITITALNDLDSRTLRDLGFDPSEIGSVAGEAAGLADATRVRVLMAQGPIGV
ncbi:MAG: DUF1127 domain-containing protein [Betaproteobacteria bacterium]|jgi:uncharacterized protein YjiS (DUF1127 family)|nr:DUF1127 domain-containing protein [Betaproteobacteria bacterium]